MRSSAVYLVTILLGAIQADAQYVDGHRERISPSYTVEYKCDMFRQGDTYNNIVSEHECAQLCEAAARSVCSYHPPTKRCVVGNDNGKDIPRVGVTYMTKVVESTGDEDPFAADCDQEKDDCLQRETTLNNDLARCKADAASSAIDSATLKDVLAANCKERIVSPL